jgi:hypothetical protein
VPASHGLRAGSWAAGAARRAISGAVAAAADCSGRVDRALPAEPAAGRASKTARRRSAPPDRRGVFSPGVYADPQIVSHQVRQSMLWRADDRTAPDHGRSHLRRSPGGRGNAPQAVWRQPGPAARESGRGRRSRDRKLPRKRSPELDTRARGWSAGSWGRLRNIA